MQTILFGIFLKIRFIERSLRNFLLYTTLLLNISDETISYLVLNIRVGRTIIVKVSRFFSIRTKGFGFPFEKKLI